MNVNQKRILVFLVLIISGLFAVGFISITTVPQAMHPGNGGGGDEPVYYDILPSNPTLNDIQPDPDHDGIIELTWGASVDVYYYNIYRRDSSGAEIKIAIGLTDVLFTDGVSKEEGKYYYRIEAVNNIGEVQSNEESVTIEVIEEEEEVPDEIPEPEVPDVPILRLMVNDPNTDGEIKLEWDSISGATVYAIYRSKDGGSLETLEANFEENSYTDLVSENGVYSYKVKAGNSEGYSGYSNEKSVTVQLTNIPTNPIMNQITYDIINETVEVHLDWDGVICESYNVYRSVNYGDYILIEENIISTSYSDLLTETGVWLVSYSVSAVNGHGESGLSNPMSVNINPEGEPLADYTMLYTLLSILLTLTLVGTMVIILVKRKKK